MLMVMRLLLTVSTIQAFGKQFYLLIHWRLVHTVRTVTMVQVIRGILTLRTAQST